MADTADIEFYAFTGGDEMDVSEQVAALTARIDAQRAAFAVVVTAIGDADAMTKANIMRGLYGFERALRQTNERAAVLIELRAIREAVTVCEKPVGSAVERVRASAPTTAS